MPDPVKNKRRYSSRLRERQARKTQETVLAAAHRLFVEQGWSRSTMAAIAREAGVSVETVYSVFGNKPTILGMLVRNAVRGDDPEVPLLQQEATRRLAATSSQREQVRIFANAICAVLERVAPLITVARSAVESDLKLRPLFQELHDGRRRNLRFVAEALSARGPLRRQMSVEDATDHIFRIASPELFVLMRQMEGLGREAVIDWLEEVLACLLLPED